MSNQVSNNSVKLTREQYHQMVEEEFSKPPVKIQRTEAAWQGLLTHANEIVGDDEAAFFLKRDAAYIIISYYFYKSMNRILAKYPSLSGYAQVLEKTTHPDFPAFSAMFLEKEGASILIPRYVQDGLHTAPVIDNALDDCLLIPVGKVKSKCA